MAENVESLQELIQKYKDIRDPNTPEGMDTLAQIKIKMKDMPAKERSSILKDMRESNIAVWGQEPRQDSVYDVIMQIHCDMVAEAWTGRMFDHIREVRNGNFNGQNMQELITQSLETMAKQDPQQYRVFVNAVNNRQVNPLNNGVEKTQQVMNIEISALQQLKEIVNTFDMQYQNNGMDENGPEGM